MARRHLFLAATSSALGELNLARDVARALLAQGDEAVFLAPRAVAFLFEGTAVRHVAVDDMLPRLPQLLPAVLQREKADSLVLVDLTSVFLSLETVWATEPDFLLGLPLPVVALDVWDLPETDMRWDFGSEATPINPRALEIKRRMVPVPFAQPRADGVHYAALPVTERPGPALRNELRQGMGLGEQDRLVLLLSSRWQLPEGQFWKHHQRLARHVPTLALEAVAALGPRAHVAHVGPQPFAGAELLGERYHFIAQLKPERFQALMGSADLLLTFNTSATSTLSALDMGLPVLLAVNSRAGRTVDDVVAGLPSPPAEPVRRWLENVAPLYPFRVWPLGLHGLLTPVLKGNPFQTAVRTVEVLDWEGLIAAGAALLFEGPQRETALRGQASYCELVRSLPGPADVLLRQL